MRILTSSSATGPPLGGQPSQYDILNVRRLPLDPRAELNLIRGNMLPSKYSGRLVYHSLALSLSISLSLRSGEYFWKNRRSASCTVPDVERFSTSELFAPINVVTITHYTNLSLILYYILIR